MMDDALSRLSEVGIVVPDDILKRVTGAKLYHANNVHLVFDTGHDFSIWWGAGSHTDNFNVYLKREYNIEEYFDPEHIVPLDSSTFEVQPTPFENPQDYQTAEQVIDLMRTVIADK